MKKRVIKGFTLIELLVVISIIGILTTLVAANLNSARSRARDAQRKSDLRNIATALRLYYNDYGAYPRSSSGNIKGCLSGGASNCTWGQPWTAGSGPTTYMATLPDDPLSSQGYYYTWISNNSYTIAACLENSSDSSGKTNDVAGFTCSTDWIFEVVEQ